MPACAEDLPAETTGKLYFVVPEARLRAREDIEPESHIFKSGIAGWTEKSSQIYLKSKNIWQAHFKRLLATEGRTQTCAVMSG